MMKNNKQFTISKIALSVLLSLLAGSVYAVDFNTDVLDAADKKNIDFSRFSQAGYIMPGQYQMQVMVNGQAISPSSLPVSFLDQTDPEKGSGKQALPQACLTPPMVALIGLTASSLEKVTYRNDGKCADLSELKGVTLRPDLSNGILAINMPQAWMEYSDASWLPPSRWDNGIPGLLLDYNINATVNSPHQGQQSQSVNYNGTVGANVGSWRMRADYQGAVNHLSRSAQGSDTQFDWNRFYMYRAIPRWRAKLTVGENYTNSDIFNAWRYLGTSLESDDRMLPPKLRGYAPQISGIADTNARVVVSQQGRILYDSTVPAGPFTIQDLDSSVRGRLNVEIIEQNGQRKTFQVDTASVPYLTRPGQIRYKLFSGRSRNGSHTTEGPLFMAGEASWGINNTWSLYGGAVAAGEYNALAVGAGRDLYQLGTIAVDVTQSVARLPGVGSKQGKSWRLSYSKRFDEANADITFAGYRFSERNYMTMEQYLDARYRNNLRGREKELYTVSLNKSFDDWNTSIGIQYSYQTYWDQRSSDNYSVSVNNYFDIFGFKNISAGISASRARYSRNNDIPGANDSYNDSIFMRLSIPWSNGTVSYSGNMSAGRYTQTAGYSDTLNGGLDSYNVSAGVSTGDSQGTQGQLSGYYNHSSPLANLSANFSTLQRGYTSFGLNASGGATLTTKGVALHAGGVNGGTRLLVDTDGIGGVPIDGGRVFTNRWGVGVVTDVNSYYRNTTSVDLNKLPDDMEATRSVVESVLTEGAIGYRKFEVLKGARLFVVLRLADNSVPPFGASVTNAKGRELGMVGDAGLAWLSGVVAGEKINIGWGEQVHCVSHVPDNLKSEQQLLLPCRVPSEIK
ncbi:fimbria/pilus outer membrane usher protein [Edwardsiella piscicida]|uniref:fimbria/pilus outer membrane usher protein n=1 Tax=Edwardsiella piscicida TaxID=1263550 RepID=UPI00370D0EE5